MADPETVEKRLNEQMLDSGELSFGEQERVRLGLGRHSEDVPVLTADGEKFVAHWAAGRGKLGGEELGNYLQETARVGSLARLARSDGGLALTISGTGASSMSGGAWWTTTSPRAQAPRPPQRKPRLRITGSGYRLRRREEYVWHGNIGFLREANALISEAVRDGGWDPAEAVAVRLEGELLATLDQFDELLAVDVANIDHLPHQEAAARTVLARMQGRGVLADEVGLGKTVEAGLILKELVLRGLANRMLILCPAPLRDQWRQELKDKFDEDFTVVASGKDPALGGDKLIMTQMLATRNPDKIKGPFDLVVIDEAHRLAGANAATTRRVLGALVAEAPRALLLTATPVQNSLLELYRLVEVLRPGTFRSQAEFTRQFMRGGDPRKPTNTTELRKLVSSVIVRTTRQQAGLDRVRRMPPRDIGVTLAAPERCMYDLLVHTLRHKMSGPQDAQRRRHLALRLTASPVAVSRMALRMAQTHENEAVREVLREVGHLAADIGETERDRRAVAVIGKWLNEHGRVLVFSQHTQTVSSLVRTLARHGIAAGTFHGGMSASARADSIAAFRAGKSPVLVSTDAGAEGLNLQVCNCVVNFDLPWNPMRVEQRIGRVHRLTQERDVHIANIFARGTIDESVYRLLHDKLAMFELLFGQVVTVLGELDDTDQSMEGRVLEALCADSDAAMQRRLDVLGEKLEVARNKAGQMIRSDGDLSGWLAEQHKEREGRKSRQEADELRPRTRGVERRRQAEVEHFIRRFFALAGVEVTYEADQFMSVVLSPRLSAALGGISELHLAFSHRALDLHPEAELCVVGSEFFDLIMAALRDHGDLTGTTQALPAVDSRAVHPHADWIRLDRRTLRALPGFTARATYRIHEGSLTGRQDLVSVEVGEPPAATHPQRVPVPDGGRSPAPPKDVLEAIEAAATLLLDDRLRHLRGQITADNHNARRELTANLQAQHDEVVQELRSTVNAARTQMLRDRRAQLERALGQATRSVSEVDTTETRAELLALELHGSADLELIEEWVHADGGRHTVSCPWPGSLDAVRYIDPQGRLIDTLALCCDGHPAEANSVRRCGWCPADSCASCAQAKHVTPCLVCGREMCPTCRSGALCRDCNRPERLPERDTAWEVAWLLGDGRTLLVGQRHASLVDGGAVHHVVPDADVTDPGRIRVRRMAKALNLPPSAGLASAPDARDGLGPDAVWSLVHTDCWWETRPGGGSSIDPVVYRALPELDGDVPVKSEGAAGVDELLRRLREEVPPPVPPTIIRRPLATTHRIRLVGDGLVHEEAWQQDDEAPILVSSVPVDLTESRHQPIPGGVPVARADLAGVVRIEIDGIHRSYLLRFYSGATATAVFLPDADGVTLAGEAAWASWTGHRGLEPGVLLTRFDVLPPEPPGSGRPGGPAVERTSRTAIVLAAAEAARPARDADLPADAWAGGKDGFEITATALEPRSTRGFRQALEAFRSGRRVVAVEAARLVDELWRSDQGSAIRRYVICAVPPITSPDVAGRIYAPPGVALPPEPDLDSGAGSPLTVDAHGHLVTSDSITSCPVCGTASCPLCGPGGAVAPCDNCLRPACGNCRTSIAPVARSSCVRCGDHSCGACSRHLPLDTCVVCARAVCSSCREGSICRTCDSFAPMGSGEVAHLPERLHANGLHVLVAVDPEGDRVALLHGHHRLEIAVLHGDEVRDWLTLLDASADTLAVALAFALRAGTGDVQVLAAATPDSSPPTAGLVVHEERIETPVWELARGGTTLHARQPAPVGRPTPLSPELAADLLGGGRTERIPRPHPHADHAHRLLATAAQLPAAFPEAAVLRTGYYLRHEIVRVTGEGLDRWVAENGTVSGSSVPWEQPSNPAGILWARQGWAPTPDVVAIAAFDDTAAALVCIGDHVTLAIRRLGQEATWHRITYSSEELSRLLLGEALMHRRVLLSVGRVVNPAVCTWVTVSRADLESRTFKPLLLEPTSEATAPTDESLELQVAVDTYVDGRRATWPEERLMSDDALPRTLLAIARRVPHERMRRDIGLAVHETWRAPQGAPILVSYMIPPGSRNGVVRDAVTGEETSRVDWCRSRHLTNHLSRCRYCNADTCALCPDVTAGCQICGIPACGSCRSPENPLRCTACANLRELGMLERRRAISSLTGHAWSGNDARGGALVVLRKGQWEIRRTFDGTVFAVPVNAVHANALGTLLGAHE